MENLNWMAIIVGMIVAILYLANVFPAAVGAGGVAILIYGIFSKGN